MDIVNRENEKTSALVSTVVKQCSAIIERLPGSEKVVNLRSFLNFGSMLSTLLNKILRTCRFKSEWNTISLMKPKPKFAIAAILARVGRDINKFYEGLVKTSVGFEHLFAGMLVTQHMMRPYGMTDCEFLINFYIHLCEVQVAVNEIENKLEIVKNSIEKNNGNDEQEPEPEPTIPASS